MKVAGRKLMTDGADEQSGTTRGLNLAMALGRTGIRILGLALGATLMLAAALVVGLLPGELGARRCRFGSARFGAFRHAGQRRPTLFQNVRIFDGRSAALSAPSNVLVRGNTIARISAGPITVEAKRQCPGHRSERTRADARPHRRPLACVHGGDAADGPDDRRPELSPAVGGATGSGDSDARLHDGTRPRRPGVRSQARD